MGNVKPEDSITPPQTTRTISHSETPMMNMGEIVQSLFGEMIADTHVPANEGDYVDDEGFLCCGKCRERKEFKRQLPFMDRMFIVPCLCKCGRDERDRQEAEEKLRRERQAIDELYAYSLVDERFKASRFENCTVNDKNEKAVRIAKNYVAHFDELFANAKGLLLYGSPGTGKSFLASCIANALMEKNIPVMVTSILRLTQGFDEDVQERIAKMRNARLLILDDFGAERTTDFKAEQIFSVIDSRYASRKPMIITTNIPLAEMKAETDMRRRRVYDRIFETCYPVKMEWDSFRIQQVRQTYDNIKDLLEN